MKITVEITVGKSRKNVIAVNYKRQKSRNNLTNVVQYNETIRTPGESYIN